MNLEQQIEFHKIKERWIDLAVTDGAKEKIRELEIYRKESELQKAQRDTSNSRNLIEQLGTGGKSVDCGSAPEGLSGAGKGFFQPAGLLRRKFRRHGGAPGGDRQANPERRGG